MAEAGVSSVDVLRAATINNAQAFGLADDHGSIEPGKIANLVLLGQKSARVDFVLRHDQHSDRSR